VLRDLVTCAAVRGKLEAAVMLLSSPGLPREAVDPSMLDQLLAATVQPDQLSLALTAVERLVAGGRPLPGPAVLSGLALRASAAGRYDLAAGFLQWLDDRPTISPREAALRQLGRAIELGEFDQARALLKRPNTWPATSWTPDTPWGARITSLMTQVEYDYAASLLEALEAAGIRGPVVEFGVFQGEWLHVLIDACEARGLSRQFFGFDSFQGLPAPSVAADLDCFQEGQFAAGLEQVARRLETQRRDNVELVPGWFSDTLPTPRVQAIRDISYARVDCDLYGPALECLRYLGPRLADGAVLVFDDWTFDLTKGETLAFAEWLPEVPDLTFEFLCFNGVGHFYLRVRRR
jgi:hypothetical protein